MCLSDDSVHDLANFIRDVLCRGRTDFSSDAISRSVRKVQSGNEGEAYGQQSRAHSPLACGSFYDAWSKAIEQIDAFQLRRTRDEELTWNDVPDRSCDG